jgi:hypothetical protein
MAAMREHATPNRHNLFEGDGEHIVQHKCQALGRREGIEVGRITWRIVPAPEHACEAATSR